MNAIYVAKALVLFVSSALVVAEGEAGWRGRMGRRRSLEDGLPVSEAITCSLSHNGTLVKDHFL